MRLGFYWRQRLTRKQQNDGKLDFAWSLHPKVILPLFVELQQKKSCVKTVDGLKIFLEERLYKRL